METFAITNVTPAARTPPAFVEDGIHYIIAPRGFGLIHDPAFLRVVLRTTPRDSLHLLQHAGETLARFVSIRQRVGPLTFKVLYPLGGVSVSPLCRRLNAGPRALWALGTVLRAEAGWHLARLCALNADELMMLSADFAEQGLKRRQFSYPSYAIQGVASFDAYLGRRTKSFRSSFKASWRKAQAEGFYYRSALEAEEWSGLYRKRNGSLSGFDYSVSPGFVSFLELIIQAYRKEKRVFEVGLGNAETVIAAGLGLLHGEVLYFFQTAHDPAYHKLRPGALVFLEMIKRALEHGVKTIAFISDAPYLRLYTDQAVRLHELEVFAPNPCAKALWFYRQYRNSRPSH